MKLSMHCVFSHSSRLSVKNLFPSFYLIKMSKFWYACFVFLKIIGLAPISWHRNSSLRNPFETSPQCKIYNLVLVILYILVHVYFILNEIFSLTDDYEIFSLNHIFIAISSLVVLCTFLNFTLKQQTAAQFCNELDEIDQWLEVFNRHYKNEKFDAKLKLLISCNMFCCLWFPIGNVVAGDFNINLRLIVFNDSIISWIIIQYVWIVALMHAMAGTINDQFRNFHEDLKTTSQEVKFCNSISFHEVGVDIDNYHSMRRRSALNLWYWINIHILKGQKDVLDQLLGSHYKRYHKNIVNNVIFRSLIVFKDYNICMSFSILFTMFFTKTPKDDLNSRTFSDLPSNLSYRILSKNIHQFDGARKIILKHLEKVKKNFFLYRRAIVICETDWFELTQSYLIDSKFAENKCQTIAKNYNQLWNEKSW